MRRIIAQPPFRSLPAARTLAVVILAAGASRRLGRHKQLVRISGEALVQRVVRRVASIGPAWIGVVVGSGAASVRAALADRRVRVVHARHWRDGMAASLVAGVRAAPRAARHLAILSVDQWRLETADFGRLCRAAGRLPAAAVYAGRRGVPAIFPARLRPALLALRGDRGARALLHGERVREVPMRGACDDLDTPADLQRLRAQRVRR